VGPGAKAVSGVLIEHHHPLPPTPYQVRTSLPTDTAAFTGRREQVEAITALVEQVNAKSGAVVTIQGGVQAIDGMPGIGKTTMAVHVARQLASRFPDRQLFIDLHGHTPGADPVEAFEALGGLLTATGMDARYLRLHGGAGLALARPHGRPSAAGLITHEVPRRPRCCRDARVPVW
jgi:hypothetical protein